MNTIKNFIQRLFKDNNSILEPRVSRFFTLVMGAIVLSCAFALYAANVDAATQVSTNKLQSLVPGTEKNNIYTLTFDFADPVDKNQLKSFSTFDPDTVVLDISGAENALNYSKKKINNRFVKDVIIIQADNRTRIMINLNSRANYSLNQAGKQVKVSLIGTAASADKKESQYSALAKGPDYSSVRRQVNKYFPGKPFRPSHLVKGVDFQKGSENGGRVMVDLSDPNVAVNVDAKSAALIINFKDAQALVGAQRRLDVSDFATPIKTIDTQQRGNQVEMVISTDGDYKHLAYQVNNKFIIDVKSAHGAGIGGYQLEEKKYTGRKITLNFQDIKVRSALQVLSEFSGINMVASDEVKGNLTLRLENVPWDQALDIILKTQGLSKRQQGNVMLIAPAKDLAMQEKQELEALQQTENLVPLQSDLMQLNYAKAEDMAGLLRDKTNSILSARGSVSTDVRTNTLILQDVPDKLREVRQLLQKLDIPVKQVAIETRIVNVDETYERNLGISWGVSNDRHRISGSLRGANEIAKGTDPSDIKPLSDRLNVNLPTTNTMGSFGVALAKLGGGYLLDLELSALESEGGGELVSSPRLITSDQQAAYIEMGEEIPYQEATASGATNVQFKDAVLKLQVTPHITPDRKVLLTIKVNQDRRSPNPEVLGVPAIDTRQVETVVLVDNGQTLVLGGIYEGNKTKQLDRVPFFSKIPLVGNLFKNTDNKTERHELLIFVTPKILSSDTSIS